MLGTTHSSRAPSALFIDGRSGDDTLIGSDFDDILEGGAGNDTLLAGADRDLVSGGAGNDFLDGGSGDDLLVGGQGDDRYVVDSAGDSIREIAGDGRDRAEASVSYALPEAVEDLSLMGADAIDATGNAEANVFTGNSADNRLQGAGGDDLLDGGPGTDVAVYSGASAAYSVTTGVDGSVAVVHLEGGPDGTDALLAIERIEFADGVIEVAP